MIDVEGDGNCLYRCVSQELRGHPNKHVFYRKLAMKTIRNHPEIFKDRIHQGMIKDKSNEVGIFQTFIYERSQYGVNAGQIEMLALSYALGIQFNINGIGNGIQIKMTDNPKKTIYLHRKQNDQCPDGHFMLVKKKIQK